MKASSEVNCEMSNVKKPKSKLSDVAGRVRKVPGQVQSRIPEDVRELIADEAAELQAEIQQNRKSIITIGAVFVVGLLLGVAISRKNGD